MEITRNMVKSTCAQQLGAEDYRGLVHMVMDELRGGGQDLASAAVRRDAELRFREAAALAGVSLHGMGSVDCCGGCTARFVREWNGLLQDATQPA